jgi:hypothetical protein
MIVMREWLDLNGCEPAGFECRKSGSDAVLFVDFSTGAAAQAFQRHFGGNCGAPASAHGWFAPTAK